MDRIGCKLTSHVPTCTIASTKHMSPLRFCGHLPFQKSARKDVSPLSIASLLFYFFSLHDIDDTAELGSDSSHFLSIIRRLKEREQTWWAELWCALDGLNHILHDPPMSISIYIYIYRSNDPLDKTNCLSNARRSHGKTKAISY